MHWQYWVRGFQAQDKAGISEQLNEMDRMVGSCRLLDSPGDPHINRVEYGIFILLRKSK